MPLPSSTRFDILDYTYRAPSHGEGESFVGGEVLDSGFVQFPNVMVDGDGLVFSVNTDSAYQGTVESSILFEDALEYVDALGVEGSGIPASFSFEFDIQLTDDLPVDFSDVGNRLFVGALNQQGYSAGLIFSHQGIAYVDSPEDPFPTIIGGSLDQLIDKSNNGVFFEDGTNVRITINGEFGRVSVYAIPSKDAYDIGSGETNAPILFTAQAKKTKSTYSDAVLVKATGRSTEAQTNVLFAIRSLRLASSVLIPVDIPIASAFGPQFLTIGALETFTGADSYDPEGSQLSYNWEVEVAPEGSTASLQGSKSATATLLVASDYDDSYEGVVRITHLKPTSRANTLAVYLDADISNQPLSMEFDNLRGELLISLRTDEDGEILTTASDLVNAFNSSEFEGHNILISGGEDLETGFVYPKLFRADLVTIESAGIDKLEVGSFLFSGGTGSDLSEPGFVADKEGLYVISLQVSSVPDTGTSAAGLRRSRLSRVTFSASQTAQLLGHRPNTDYVFQYLPDFWKMVDRKEQLETVWSSVTQVLSGELLQCWQNDYAKSLRDISRKYQRRWMKYSMYESVDNPITIAPTQELHSVKELSIPHVEVGLTSIIAYGTEVWGDTPISTGKKLVMSTVGKPYVVDVVNMEQLYEVIGESTDTETLEHACEGIPGVVITEVETSTDELSPTGKYKITTSSMAFSKYRLISSRTAGYFMRDHLDPDAVIPVMTNVYTDEAYKLFKVLDDDIIRIDTLNEALLTTISERSVGGVDNHVRLVDQSGEALSQHVNGVANTWEHLRPEQNTFLHTTPYLELPDDFDLSSYNFTYGDLFELKFIDPYSNAEVSKCVPVLAIYGSCVFLEWDRILEYLSDRAASNNDLASVYDINHINLMVFRLSGFYRTRKLEKVDDLVSVATLGFNTIVPEMVEGVDYTIEDGCITILDFLSGGLSTTADSPVVTLNAGYKSHKELGSSGLDDELMVQAGVHAIQIDTGPDAGFYRIQSVDTEAGTMTLNESMTCTSMNVLFRSPRFCPFYKPPGTNLWAEISYFDNWQTIENNFGLFVGLPKSVVENYDPNLDYLSVIKSMWFAFLSGPSFDNVKLAIQALFGLPYTETAGQVTIHEPATPDSEGVLVLVADGGRVHTHKYPYGASLSINPRTGRQIKAFSSISAADAALLSSDKKSDLNDSIVDAYVRLVDVVEVDDYISDPQEIEQIMSTNDLTYIDDAGAQHVVDIPPSIIQKYHTFVVDVPLGLTKSTSTFPLIREFLQEAKPAYTNFILRGSLLLHDEISVIDEPFYYPTLLLKDTPHTSPFFAVKDAVDSFGMPVISEEKEKYIWPVKKTYEKHDIDFSPILEAACFCLSGLYYDSDVLAAYEPGDPWIPRLWVDETIIGTSLGRYNTDTLVYEYHPVIEQILQSWNRGVFPSGGIAIAIPGTPDFELFEVNGVDHYHVATDDPNIRIVTKIGFTLTDPEIEGPPTPWKVPSGSLAPYASLNCLFFTPENFPPPMPVLEYWDDEDVKEKYESGYSEGVLDDYSGDGSWNMRRSQLDMVNTLNSDLDVVRTRQWVPINHLFNMAPEFSHPDDSFQRFFQIGDTLTIEHLDGTPVDCIWNAAPPVVLHVGYGDNPKLPYVEHPGIPVGASFRQSYLLIGYEVPRQGVLTVEDSDNYDYESVGLSNYGREDRLTALQSSLDEFTEAGLRLRGSISQAVARPEDFGHLNPTKKAQYEETIWQLDKLIENGPASDPTLTITTYVPVGGMTITDFRATSDSFTKEQYQWESQMLPLTEYPPSKPDEMMKPSFNPGFYTSWDLEGGDPDVEKVVWGFDLSQDRLLEWSPTPIDGFRRPSNHAEAYLQNVHIGMTISARKEYHSTQGFTNFRIPAPSIKMVLPSSAGYDLRICGFYFCDDDPTRATLPTAEPESFGDPESGVGAIGGSWVFFRNSQTLEEISDVDWNFEKGNHSGLPILPTEPLADGTPTFILGSADQRSDGHIIECHIPELPSEGYYDIIIRNYRPYLEPGESNGDASTWAYLMEETVAEKAYYHSPEGHGIAAWGTDPFGAGGA